MTIGKKSLGNVLPKKVIRSVEIDEREIIGNNTEIYWMFRIIERVSKEAGVFCVLNNKTQLNLLKIFEDNVASNNVDDLYEDNINEDYLVNIRVYSNCFRKK